ncbi:MAG: DUF45 domain-containing protein [Ramlibacter sp.]|nr:DUF45 domain-containing protein [Ramlibacter sp.]
MTPYRPTELVNRTKDLIEYAAMHELAHLLQPTHRDWFVALPNLHWPQWRDACREWNGFCRNKPTATIHVRPRRPTDSP